MIGGAENTIKGIMDYLSKKHEVTVYTTTAKDIEAFWNRDSPKIKKNNFTKYEIKRFEILTPSEIKFNKDLESFYFASNHPGPFSTELWKEIVQKKINFDLIIAASYPYDHVIPAYIASKKWQIPLIVYPMIHQEFVELFLNSIKLTMLKNSESVIVNTNSEKKILKSLGIHGEKIFLHFPITYPFDIEKSNPSEFRNKFLPDKKGRIVLFAGLKSFVKGTMHLVEAMKKVWAEAPDTILVLIGPSSKEFDDYFKKLSDKTKEKIIDLGILDENDKKNAFAACDVFALPSKSESFGIVYVEAWAFKKPVIGCSIASTSELIENEKDGLLAEFGDVKKLAKNIIQLINNPSICEKYGNEGKKKSIKFSSEDNLKKFENRCISTVEIFKKK